MNNKISVASVLFLLVSYTCGFGGQADKVRSSAQEAAELRSDLAEVAARNGQRNQETLQKLKASRNPSGLAVGRDADFALAAIDVGQRLAAKGEMRTAEPFFLEAEKALTAAIGVADAKKAPDLVMLLQKRAMIRARYLNQRVAAKADAERALKLQPDSAYLKAFRISLDNDQDEQVKQYARRKEGSR